MEVGASAARRRQRGRASREDRAERAHVERGVHLGGLVQAQGRGCGRGNVQFGRFALRCEVVLLGAPTIKL